MRKFQAKSLAEQNGTESHFISDVQPQGDIFYDESGKLKEAVGIFERVANPLGSTTAVLKEVVFADEKKSAEDVAKEKLKGYSDKGEKSEKEKPEKADKSEKDSEKEAPEKGASEKEKASSKK